MNTIIRCSCGARLRVPTALHGQTVRCPRCRSELPTAMPTAAPARSSFSGAGAGFTARDADVGSTCPICLTAVAAGELLHRCPECDLLHHAECWAEVGGCGTFGCKQAPVVEKIDQAAQTPLTGWGDTKECPVCGESIKSIALKCRYCGMEFSSADPISANDLRRQARRSQQDERLKRITIGTLVASITGCLAPLALIFGLVYLLPRRPQLARCGPLFVIIGYTSLVLSGLYCLLLLAFLLFSY